jgi:LysM repeat protein
MKKEIALSVGLLLLLAGCNDEGLSQDERENKIERVVEARSFMESGQYAEAEESFKRALVENPTIARPHLDLATLYQQHIINYVHAIYHYDRYLELRPKSEKKALIEQQRIKVEQMLAHTLLQSTPHVQALVAENKTLKQELVRLRSSAQVQPTRSTVANVPSSTETAEPKHSVSIYHVEPGDTLSKIAKRFYNDSGKWDRIYQANRDSLQSPSGIRVGQTLVIPLVQ